MHYLVGNLGHIFVITSFITSLVTAFSYYKATTSVEPDKKLFWLQNGRAGFMLHAAAVVGISICLFTIIFNHYYEYHYAYNYTDRKLPIYYLISTFWNGQEGSFLLWLFWQAILGLILIRTNKFWEGPVMTTFSIVQAFLASMVLGVVIPGLNLKLGSSPFILLRDAMPEAPIFAANPEYVPKDGQGLNELLQNYWMVIHPPTLFLGYASTLVPFAFCMAGLWLRKYRDWVRPALPWALFSGAILGLGILMGGYWAYETLSFGGYWNWDPVENSVFVPWLVLIGAIHTMITYRNSETALKAAMFLVIGTFILVLYATFLTRSGILGDASVHSFTDLGLSGQLLIYLLFFLVAGVALIVWRWKEIPFTEKEASVYSREFWIFIGAIVLCLMSFQILLPTSIPVWNKLLSLVGIDANIAPPADQVKFYSKVQLWFAVAVGLLSGIGQFFWWRNVDLGKLKKELIPPTLITLGLFAIIITIGQVYKVPYMVLTLAGVFTLVSNATILVGLLKNSPSLSGGAVAHIGVGLMLIGMMFSSGYSRVVSLNNTGMLISKQFSKEFNRDNLFLFVNETRTMWGYDIEYFGERLEPRHHGGYIRKSDVNETDDRDKVVAKFNISVNGQAYKAKDTIEIKGENTFYEIQLRKGDRAFTLYPRAQINPEMGGLLPSPDIYRTVSADLFTTVSSAMKPAGEDEWSDLQEMRIKQGEQFFANDYVCVLESVDRVYEVEGIDLTPDDVAVKAHFRVQGEHGDYFAEPIFVIKNRLVGRIPDEIRDLGLRMVLMNIHPETNDFTIATRTRQKDWVVIKAVEMPYINVVWIGTLVLMIGFGIAMTRRIREFNKMKEKGLE
ncbi:MAG TPA: cytochrome c biogenesis protein CcsA [Chryseolinea sp.]|nr:cytochrome c biogenesis protein CcsA [Chryseolinea sp.]